VRANLLGSDSDPGGERVVTYNGWPLYLYATDLKLGLGSAVANGQGHDIDGATGTRSAPTAPRSSVPSRRSPDTRALLSPDVTASLAARDDEHVAVLF
jgi:hypothetical protein